MNLITCNTYISNLISEHYSQWVFYIWFRLLDIKKDYIPIKMQSSGILGAFLVSSSGFTSKLQLFTFWIVWRSLTRSLCYMLWLYWGSPRSVRVIVSLVTSRACRSWQYDTFNQLQNQYCLITRPQKIKIPLNRIRATNAFIVLSYYILHFTFMIVLVTTGDIITICQVITFHLKFSFTINWVMKLIDWVLIQEVAVTVFN